MSDNSLVKVLLHPSRATPEQVAMRMNVCKTCEHRVTKIKVEVCGVCSCPLIARTFFVRSSCPKGKWVAVEV